MTSKTSKKSNKKQIWMSVVALLLIVLTASGIAYSWIEGGTTYTMETEEDKGITIKAPENYPGTLNIDPANSGTKALISYDLDTKNYNDLIFSPMSSKDGENFYIPEVVNSNGNIIKYRSVTTNDVGKNHINFSFDYNVPDNEVFYLALKAKPQITATKSGVQISDVSPFRIMLSNGTDKYIFAGDGTATTTNVINSVGGSTASFTTKATTNYITNSTTTKNRLFDYNDGYTGTIQVVVWLESSADATALEALHGSDITLSFDLEVQLPYYLIGYHSVRLDSTGTEVADRLTTAFKGGDIQIGNGTTLTKKGMHKLLEGSELVLKAIPKENYEFEGWYLVQDGTEGSRLSTNTTYSVTPTSDAFDIDYVSNPANSTTYYLAKFKEKPKYTISVEGSPTEGGTVSVGATAETATDKSYEGYKDTTAVLKAVANNGYKFIGWYDNADGAGDAVSTSEEHTVTISANKTYYAFFRASQTTTIYIERRDGYDKTDYYLHIYNKDNEDIHYPDGASWPGIQADYHESTGWHIYQFDTADVGNFRVIVSDVGGSQYPGSGEPGLEGVLGGTYIFTTDGYLIEITEPMYTIYVAAYPASYGTALVSGVNSYVENSSQIMIRNGNNVKLSASPSSSSYGFLGWYEDVDCDGKVDTTKDRLLTTEANPTYSFSKIGSSAQEPTLLAYFGEVSSYTAKAIAVTDSTSSDSTGGTVQVTGASAAATSSASVNSGTSVTFTAVAKSGYTFKGWYTSATSTTVYNSNASFSETISGNKTYYAKFEKNTTITVYFTDNYSWGGTINCHYWGGSTSTGWPGVAMTYVKTNQYSQKVYKVTIPADSTGIIFNSNGSVQTVDITTNIADGKGFYISGQSGSKYTVTAYDYS